MDENDKRDGEQPEVQPAHAGQDPPESTAPGETVAALRAIAADLGAAASVRGQWEQLTASLMEQRQQFGKDLAAAMRGRVEVAGLLESTPELRDMARAVEVQQQEVFRRTQQAIADQRQARIEELTAIVHDGVGRAMATVAPRIDGLHEAVLALIRAEQARDIQDRKQARFNRRTTITQIVLWIVSIVLTAFGIVIAVQLGRLQ